MKAAYIATTAATAGVNRPGLLLELFRDFLHFAPDAQQVAAPDLADLLLGVAAAHELERHVERFGRAVPAVHAAAAVEVRRDADVIDADHLDGVIDVIDAVFHRRASGRRVLATD